MQLSQALNFSCAVIIARNNHHFSRTFSLIEANCDAGTNAVGCPMQQIWQIVSGS